MSAWCRIGFRQFHRDDAAVPFMDPKLEQLQLLTDAGVLKSTTGAENASMTLVFGNPNGKCTQLFAMPPLGEIVPVYDGAELKFEGTLTQIDVTATDCRVTVQA